MSWSFYAERYALRFVAVSLVGTIVAMLGLYLLLGRIQSPLLVFDVTAEQFSQIVVRPDLTAFAVSGAEIDGARTCAAEGTYDGIVEAPSGSRLTYRWRPEQISISIDVASEKSMRFVTAGENECVEKIERLTVRTNRIGKMDPAWRLPIAGPSEVGSETLASVPGTDGSRRLDLLLTGSFEVFGRAFTLGDQGTLYPISSSPLTIPNGSRLRSMSSTDSTSIWFGSALHGDDGFVISATAEANSVVLFRPGRDQQQEHFDFGVFASIAGDPNLGMIFLVLFIAVTVVQLAASWMGFWSPGKDDRA